jgi:hypothetical protein
MNGVAKKTTAKKSPAKKAPVKRVVAKRSPAVALQSKRIFALSVQLRAEVCCYQ